MFVSSLRRDFELGVLNSVGTVQILLILGDVLGEFFIEMVICPWGPRVDCCSLNMKSMLRLVG